MGMKIILLLSLQCHVPAATKTKSEPESDQPTNHHEGGLVVITAVFIIIMYCCCWCMIIPFLCTSYFNNKLKKNKR